MKKVSIAAVFLTLVLSLSGCLNDDGANFYDEPIPIVEVSSLPDSLEPGETYGMDFSYLIPSECHTYIGYQGWVDNEESNDSVRVVKFAAFARVQASNDSCRTLNIVRNDSIDDFTISTSQPIPTSYSVQFWNGRDNDGDDKFLTYNIPVKEEE